MEFRILGPLEVVADGRSLPLGGARQRALLALLLTRANEVVSSDVLIDALWGERPPQAPANALQYHVSQLRKALTAADVIATREPGYVIEVPPDALDLLRFERLVEQAGSAAPEQAGALLREALALWRGRPLADLAYEPFAQSEIARLEELRAAALELRIDADLVLGRHARVVAELEASVRQYPLREGFRAQLMLALYRSGRQAEALEAYRQARRTLSEELGIEPAPALRELEQAILRHDPALAFAAPPASVTPLVSAAPATPVSPAPARALLVVASDDASLDDLLGVAEPLARHPPRELIIARLVASSDELASATASLVERRTALAERRVAARVAAYTAPEQAAEIVLLATDPRVDLLLVHAPPAMLEANELADDLAAVLRGAPCDVAILRRGAGVPDGPVVTPFGGADHEWSAIELAAWLASALGTSLRLLGTEADAGAARRDASRLLARASLVVQEVVGVASEPRLVAPGADGVAAGARDSRLLVLGVSERWRSEGIGRVRLEAARRAGVPALFVRRGLRPSGVAPSETMTRFSWTLASA